MAKTIFADDALIPDWTFPEISRSRLRQVIDGINVPEASIAKLEEWVSIYRHYEQPRLRNEAATTRARLEFLARDVKKLLEGMSSTTLRRRRGSCLASWSSR